MGRSSFNTVIGVVFLLIVLISPGGLMGIWERVLQGLGRRPAARPRGRGSGSVRKGGQRTANSA